MALPSSFLRDDQSMATSLIAEETRHFAQRSRRSLPSKSLAARPRFVQRGAGEPVSIHSRAGAGCIIRCDAEDCISIRLLAAAEWPNYRLCHIRKPAAETSPL